MEIRRYTYSIGNGSSMALSDTAFTALAEAALSRLANAMELLDEEGEIEVELLNGVLSIDLPSGRQFIVNRHMPSHQLWLSSPLSGGLHFGYDEQAQDWMLSDGRKLESLLKAEVETLMAEE